jgi:dTDP-4-amino-4,6-dideoxygalactose transaminase
VIGCSNGTDALILALRALGVGPGDEVITVSNTFFATTEAIFAVGASPVFVDISMKTGLMDVSLVERSISTKTKAILPVHLYGHPVEMEPLLELCKKHALFCIEDAAQAAGAFYKGIPAGTIAQLGAFSFYPGKNLGALGDAGAVVTNDESLAKTIRLYRDHGRTEKYIHLKIASNMRMDGLQAAFLREKLPYLSQWCLRRREIADRYFKELSEVPGVTLLSNSSDVVNAYHLFVILCTKRDEIRERLRDRGVECGIHYPVGCHQQPALQGIKAALPVTEKFSSQCLSLPIFPEMTDAECGYVCEMVREVAAQ